MGGARREHLQADQVEHVVAGQAANRQHDEQSALASQRSEARQLAGEGQVDQQHAAGDDQAKPGHGDRVHHLEDFLQLDRQDAPEHGGDQGEKQAELPTAGRNVHGSLDA
ncbi:hypothetical protein D3C80_1762960 [compost metagenome]